VPVVQTRPRLKQGGFLTDVTWSEQRWLGFGGGGKERESDSAAPDGKSLPAQFGGKSTMRFIRVEPVE
jgi:hypothetical protein